LSAKKTKQITELESIGATKRNLKVELKETPEVIQLPNDDYCFYNKASNERLYSKPKYVIFWKDDGDACLTFKKTGKWYLHGVGGATFFKKEAITWQLISSKINVRYLPEGYILDSGSPVAVLREGIKRRELFFILGWLLTDIATKLLKNVINHTMNIQSKDIEKLPYPAWVSESNKTIIVGYIKKHIKLLHKNGTLPEDFLDNLNKWFRFQEKN
jgi:hypothetical protein